MFYLLWTAVNGVVLIYFFASCVASVKAIRERVGLLPLLLVVAGLVGFSSGSPGAAAPVRAGAHPVVLDGAVANDYVTVQNYYIAAIGLRVVYKPEASAYQLLHSSAHFTGLQLGNTWQSIATGGTVRANQLYYYVDGVMTWRLLHIPIYREQQHFTGVLALH